MGRDAYVGFKPKIYFYCCMDCGNVYSVVYQFNKDISINCPHCHGEHFVKRDPIRSIAMVGH